jgi:hypothetical protein
MIHFITINNDPSNPQQPIYSLRSAPVSYLDRLSLFVKVVHNWQQNMVRTFWSRLLEPPVMVEMKSVHVLQSMVVSRFHASRLSVLRFIAHAVMT